MRQKSAVPTDQMHVSVDRNLCFYCGACVAVCPPDSIFLENAHLKIDDETCTRCERCTNMCPVHALSMTEMSGYEKRV
jgi:ferredoxin